MAISNRSGMIDGFTSVQAVRHKGVRKNDGNSQKDKAPPNKKEEPSHQSVQSQKVSVSRTALPSRHELICYTCQYKFVVTGSLEKVFCPKCREQLETGDHTVEGEWTRDILTVGKVYIKSGAKVLGASIIATDIVIGGDCSRANLKPTRQIELETGAVVSQEVLNNHKIIIRSGSRLVLDTPLRCSDLDVYGELHAKVIPTGKVTVHSGGMFRGELIAHHLIVHEGGGLSAKLCISPQKSKAESKASVSFQKEPPNGNSVSQRVTQITSVPISDMSRPSNAKTERHAVAQEASQNSLFDKPQTKKLQQDKSPESSSRTAVSNKSKKQTSKRKSSKVK